MAEAIELPESLEKARLLAIRHKRLIVFLTILLLLGAYTSFITADIYSLYLETIGQKTTVGSEYSKYLKFACILLCFTLTLLIGNDKHDLRDRTLIQVALGLTVIADFLIGIRGQFIAGVGVFFFVQIALIIRHSRGFVWNKKEIISAIIIFGGVGLIFVLFILPLLSGVMLIAVPIYAIALTTSVWMGIGTIWRDFYTRTLDWFIAIGIVAFFFCDVNVGLNAALAVMNPENTPEWVKYLMNFSTGRLRMNISNPNLLGQLFAAFIWYWYLPAQTLLSLSGYKLSFLRSIFPLIPILPEPDEAA